MKCLQLIAMAAVLFALSGCATTSDPASRVGSKTWHEVRILEIGAAYDAGEITKEEHLRLKNETDAIRADQIAAAQDRSRVYTSIGFGYYGGHRSYRYGHGHRHRGRLHR